MASPAPVHALVLAAGRASRFGGEKLLAPLEGHAVIAWVLAVADAARARGWIDSLTVVVNDAMHPVAGYAAAYGAGVVVAPDAGQGLSASLKAGVAAVTAQAPPGPAALLVLLGDQPGVRPEVLRDLAARWRETGAGLVRPRWLGAPDAPGHPVLLDRAHWGLADGLEGDRGLEPALRAHGLAPDLLDVPGTNPDIDTPADLAAWPTKETRG